MGGLLQLLKLRASGRVRGLIEELRERFTDGLWVRSSGGPPSWRGNRDLERSLHHGVGLLGSSHRYSLGRVCQPSSTSTGPQSRCHPNWWARVCFETVCLPGLPEVLPSAPGTFALQAGCWPHSDVRRQPQRGRPLQLRSRHYLPLRRRL